MSDTPQHVIGRQGMVLGLPFCGRPVQPEWAISYASLNFPANMNLTVSAIKGIAVDEARCRIAEHAINLGAKYLFFLDDDTAPPYFAVRRLVYALEQADDKTMIAAGIYANKHTYPSEPMVFMHDGDGPFWKWKYGQVFECGSIGTGCMLIKTEVFKHLEKPWFRTINECSEDSNIRKIEMTDDLYFCKKVRDAGFKILADGGVVCVHWDVFSCACGHPDIGHNQALLARPCLAQQCKCKTYRMEGRAFLLPEDSYPMRVDDDTQYIEKVS